MEPNPSRMPIAGFRTARLSVEHCATRLADRSKRAALIAELSAWLTPNVLEDLPGALQVGSSADAVSTWMDDRVAESHVYGVGAPETCGLLILAGDLASGPDRALHIGYLFSESVWGRGYASELIGGLIGAVRGQAPLRLIGGVARRNPASARVLTKHGFVRDATMSDDDTDVFVRAVGDDPV